MAYVAPYIDEAGLHLADYQDILSSLTECMKRIYGQDIYLANDSQDYQLLSAFALIIYDTQQAILLAYNNNSPTSAIGTGLDRIVALNGIRRAKASYSTCPVKLSGTPGTTINNGQVADGTGNGWHLPPTVTLGVDGTSQVVATCDTVGSITAAPGDLATIVTPTRGWVSVINTVSAVPGVQQETDSALRAKQKISTANPSKTVFEGTMGAIANAPGVVRYAAYENDSDVTTAEGLPPHSITLVIEGGDDETLGQLIYWHKTPGCYTNGDVEVAIKGGHGLNPPVRFYRPHDVDIAVKVRIKTLEGYTDATAAAIKQSIYHYVNALAIGEQIYTANLNSPVLAALGDKPSFYVVSLEGHKVGETAAATTIPVSLIEAARISMTHITVEVVV